MWVFFIGITVLAFDLAVKELAGSTLGILTIFWDIVILLQTRVVGVVSEPIGMHKPIGLGFRAGGLVFRV